MAQLKLSQITIIAIAVVAGVACVYLLVWGAPSSFTTEVRSFTPVAPPGELTALKQLAVELREAIREVNGLSGAENTKLRGMDAPRGRVGVADLCSELVAGDAQLRCAKMHGKGLKGTPLVAVTYPPEKEWVSRAVHEKGNYLIGLGALFEELTKRDDFLSLPSQLCLDIGANIGLFSIIASHHGARVLGFEPSTENRRRAMLALHANRFVHSKIYPYGLGAESATMSLYLDPGNVILASDGIVVSGPDDPLISNGGYEGKGTEQQMLEPMMISTLDAVNFDGAVLKGTYFAKIDVEGFESLVLAGGEKFFALSTCRPRYVFYEVNYKLWNGRKTMRGWRSVTEFVRWFGDHGYDTYIPNDYLAGKPPLALAHVKSCEESKGAREGCHGGNPDYLTVLRA